MRFIVLASGSKGNATLLKIGDRRFLIDVGISLRQIVQRLSERGDVLTRLDGVFLTHEHIDHVGFLVAVLNKFACPVFLTEGTRRNLPRSVGLNVRESAFRILAAGDTLLLDGLTVKPFATYHDALEPCGFVFTAEGRNLVYLTDTGYFPTAKYDLIRNADAYVIESNHDPEMLLESDRPWQLKRRILDDQGHLSNEDSAFLVVNLLGERTRTIMLAHLSQECNTPDKALETLHRVFVDQGVDPEGYRIRCALQDVPMEEEDV
jgi:phosphoribosyl 1,2-cyclic phosphodiesterase